MIRKLCHMMMLVPVVLAAYLTFSVETSQAIPLDQVVAIPLDFLTQTSDTVPDEAVEPVSVAE